MESHLQHHQLVQQPGRPEEEAPSLLDASPFSSPFPPLPPPIKRGHRKGSANRSCPSIYSTYGEHLLPLTFLPDVDSPVSSLSPPGSARAYGSFSPHYKGSSLHYRPFAPTRRPSNEALYASNDDLRRMVSMADVDNLLGTDSCISGADIRETAFCPGGSSVGGSSSLRGGGGWNRKPFGWRDLVWALVDSAFHKITGGGGGSGGVEGDQGLVWTAKGVDADVADRELVEGDVGGDEEGGEGEGWHSLSHLAFDPSPDWGLDS